MKTPEVGQIVFVPSSKNSVWTGKGIVKHVVSEGGGIAVLKMLTGQRFGHEGGFRFEDLVPVEPEMKIVSLKRSTQKTGLKVYGKVLGESGKEYNVAYFRRSNFRGWICSCESFFFDMFKKKKNCKHLRFVRQQVGRYAATVQN